MVDSRARVVPILLSGWRGECAYERGKHWILITEWIGLACFGSDPEMETEGELDMA